ncbi:NACHT, LRR and PYD domains-containing protein 4 [Heterocephalus glaber]|uniref:NACHT, LRR and PYD domains-containing protein 4 n=1 Tax=Heterocephalus glaber TaxID=10181 RepID=G5CAV3_HETGA|nr:NACHT, LRR and PYD domains-containing protein 4 [Heterocephalus glaber]EHB18664.1 NACHT, LRR and PYD domains-containing protein 4 [Heterocephalus glaber]
MASPFFSDFGLMWYLEELKKKEFMKFKELLKQETPLLGLKQISWAEVKKASREELANLLLRHYEEQQAWDVTFRVFQKLGRRDLCEKAMRESTGNAKIYQTHMREKFTDFLSRESIPTMHEQLDMNITQEECKFLELLFEPEKQTRILCLLGAQGVGKTTFLAKMILAWSKGFVYQDRFSYIFYFCCKELKQLPATSLAGLITRAWPGTSAPVSEIMAHPEKLLFMADSFEELGSDLAEPEDELCSDWAEVQPPKLLLSSLLRKKMAPECCLLVTVNPRAGQDLEDRLEDPDIRELTGLKEFDVKFYICHMFPDRRRALEAFNVILNNEQLLSMCRLPVLCWLVCTTLKQEMDKGIDVALTCQRPTALYSSFLLDLFTPEGADGPSWQGQAQLQSLCSLAVQGMWTNTMVFREKDLRRNGIGSSDLSALLELRVLLPCWETEGLYKFLHSSVQEFCAALFYLLKSPGHHSHPAVRGTQDLLLTFLEKSRAHWVFVGCFLFGLLHERECQKLDAFFGFQLSSEVKRQLYQCLQQLAKVADKLQGQVSFLALFYALFEMQEEAFLNQVMDLMQDLAFSVFIETDLRVAGYCLKHCSNLRKLSLSAQGVFKEEGREQSSVSSSELLCWHQVWSVLRTCSQLQMLQVKDGTLNESAMLSLCQQLRQPNCLLENLFVNNVTFHCESWTLFEAFPHNPNLKYVNLSNTQLGRDDVKVLHGALSHPTSSVEKLLLVNCNLSADDCKALAATLMESKKLDSLNLSCNNLKKGVRALCKALCHPNCTLKFLALSFCTLREWCWDYLAEVLLISKSLSHLDLSINSLRDEGLKVLCDTLRYPVCALQILCLMKCSITAEGCRDLASVLTSSRNLRSLQIGGNNIEDAGVKLLCQALAQPSCLLETLGVEDCGLTSACCEDLVTVLTTSKTLFMLNLLQNPLDHGGVALLCQGLRHPECALRVLGLNSAEFGEETQALLTAEEERNPDLVILDTW